VILILLGFRKLSLPLFTLHKTTGGATGVKAYIRHWNSDNCVALSLANVHTYWVSVQQEVLEASDQERIDVYLF